MSPPRFSLASVLFLVAGLLLSGGYPYAEARIGASEEGPAQQVRRIELSAVTGMQYDSLRIRAEPGERVRLVLRNESSLPHNWLLTAPGAREPIVQAAAELGDEGPERDYIPSVGSVLESLPVVNPGDSASVTFTVPGEPGVYPYVCTFPGHGKVMYGALYVGSEVPELAEDPNVPPPEVRGGTAGGEGPIHPYPRQPPMMYRTFMPNSSPASIAVWLENGVSYCWDAGKGFLRYAWQGGFLDNSEIWEGHVRGHRAHLLGTVFYRTEVGIPLRIGDPENTPKFSFRGYRMRADRPEFHYRLDGAEVAERVRSAAEGTGLVRTFQVSGVEEPIWFVADEDPDISYEASAGTWQNRRLRLSPDEARSFTITMRHEP